jgi:hypothetical protein
VDYTRWNFSLRKVLTQDSDFPGSQQEQELRSKVQNVDPVVEYQNKDFDTSMKKSMVAWYYFVWREGGSWIAGKC